jgi:hypothetical protein
LSANNPLQTDLSTGRLVVTYVFRDDIRLTSTKDSCVETACDIHLTNPEARKD